MRRRTRKNRHQVLPRFDRLEGIESPTSILGLAAAVPGGAGAGHPSGGPVTVAAAPSSPGHAGQQQVVGPVHTAPAAPPGRVAPADTTPAPAMRDPRPTPSPWGDPLGQGPLARSPVAQDPFTPDGPGGGSGYVAYVPEHPPASGGEGGGGGGGGGGAAGGDGGGPSGGGGGDPRGLPPAETTGTPSARSGPAGTHGRAQAAGPHGGPPAGGGGNTATVANFAAPAATTGGGGDGGQHTPPPADAGSLQAVASPGLRFELNEGQFGGGTFVAHSSGGDLFLTSSGAVLTLARPQEEGGATFDALALDFQGASDQARAVGQSELLTRTNYFTGADPSGWYTDVPNYARVRTVGLYSGVDALWYGNGQNQPEFDLVVAPGADPSQVRLAFRGAQGVQGDGQGGVALTTAGGTLTLAAPVVTQGDGAQRHAVAAAYQIGQDGTVTFSIGAYDPGLPLTIDPVLTFSSFLGGSGNDQANGIAVDGAGSSVVVGTTFSSNFPTQGPFQSTLSGSSDAFVSKFSADGKTLLWSSFFGGTSADTGNAVALDAAGNVYFTGQTDSSGFPVTSGAYSTTLGGASDAYVVKLNASGDAELFGTFIGEPSTVSAGEEGRGIAVDSSGRAYITGVTDNPIFAGAFPTTTVSFGSSFGGGSGATDAFVTALSPDGSALYYSGYLGGTGADAGNAIAVDQAGNAYVTGTVSGSFPPPTFPTTAGVMQSSYGGGTSDAFVAEVNAGGAALGYATFLGGSLADSGNGIAVDLGGVAIVAGSTSSTNFPTHSAYQSANAGGQDAFVALLAPGGTSEVYGSYLGGSGTDAADAVVYVGGILRLTGSTTSTNFPTASPTQPTLGGGKDAFLTMLAVGGSAPGFSTYIGGSSDDEGRAIAADLSQENYIAGVTSSSSGFPVVNPYQGSLGGGSDAFVTAVGLIPPTPSITTILDDTGASSTDFITTDQTLTITGTAAKSSTVTLYRSGVGLVGTATADSSGNWSYNYTGTTLAEGTYTFWATDTITTVTGPPSAPVTVVVDRTAPTVTLSVPSSTGSRAPVVTVVAADRGPLPNGTTVTLDVDLNNDGDFLDAGEASYATGTLTDGLAQITLPALPASGSYHVRASVTDLAGNTTTTASQSFTVTSSSWAISQAVIRDSDPASGLAQEQLGDVSVAHALDMDLSPGGAAGGDPMLVYHGDSVHVRPVVQATLTSDNGTSLPAQVGVKLTWNGGVQNQGGTVDGNGFRWLSTTGLSPGDLVTVAAQVDGAVSTTGRYGWSVTVRVNGTDYTQSGAAYVRVEDASPFGGGWGLTSVSRLVSIAADANGPAGVLWLYGTGGFNFFTDAGSGAYTNPAGVAGTLTKSGSTWSFTSPERDVTNFNSDGTESSWVSPDGFQTLSFTYTSGQLTGVTATDGTGTTVNYTSGKVSSLSVPGSRTFTLSVNGSGDLASVTDPDTRSESFTYNTVHQLTDDSAGSGADQLESSWTYDSTSGLLTGGRQGSSSSPTTWTITPAAADGLASLYAGTVQAVAADALGRTTRTQMDGRGRILVQVDPGGGTTSYTRDATTTWVTGVTDPMGRATGYHLDTAGYVTQVDLPNGTDHEYYTYDPTWHLVHTSTDARGHVTTTAYDLHGHIDTVTDAYSKVTDYTFSSTTGLLSSVQDASGNTVSYGYDSYRRLTSETNPLGTSYLTYDSYGNVATYQDARTNTWTEGFDQMGRWLSEQDPAGNTASESYTTAGLPSTSTDREGVVGKVQYDPYDRGLETVTVAASGSGVAATDLTQYDQAGTAVGSRDGAGSWLTTSYAFDGGGEIDTVRDLAGDTTVSKLDLDGDTTDTWDALGLHTQFTFNSMGEMTSEVDARGKTWSYSFDADGNPTTKTDPLSHTQTWAYDNDNRLSSFTDGALNATTYSYYDNSDLKDVTDPTGAVTHYAYNWASKQVTVTSAYGTLLAQAVTQTVDANGNTTALEDALGHSTTFTFNTRNFLTGASDALSHGETYGTNKNGETTSITDALSKTTTLTLDKLGQVTKTTDANGNSTQTMYDGDGREVQALDGLGRASKNVYNDLGQVAFQVDALGGVTAYKYDPAGNLVSLTDPDGNTTTWQYDENGQKTKETLPTGGTYAWTHDDAGRVLTQVDPLGREIDYTYYNNDLVHTEVWKDSGGTTVNTVTYTYDNDGRLLTASDNSGTVTDSYDTLGRLKTHTDVYGMEQTYTYDLGDRMTGVSDNMGGSETLGYDNANRLTSLSFADSTSGGQLAEAFSYNNRDQVTEVDRYSDSAATTMIGKTLYGYDDGGRTTSVTHKNAAGTTTLDSFNYQYDAANQVTQETSTLGPTKNYTYDKDGQVTGDGTHTYSWDANGNSAAAGSTITTGNQLSTDGTWNYAYDAAGNETSKTKIATGEVWLYGYDNRNRLVRAQHKATSGGAVDQEVDYKYDALNNRVEKDVDPDGAGPLTATVTKFAYDQNGNAWADLNAAGTSVVTRRLYLGAVDALFARIDSGGTVNWYLDDMLGSVRDITDSAGVIQDHIDYDPFGAVTAETHPSTYGDRYKYTSREWDVEISLQYNRARYYDPATHRWISQDPMGFDAGDSNLYRNCLAGS